MLISETQLAAAPFYYKAYLIIYEIKLFFIIKYSCNKKNIIKQSAKFELKIYVIKSNYKETETNYFKRRRKNN